MTRIFIRGNAGEFANYTAALESCGMQPVLSMTLSDADSCDGLLVPGGADVNPALYGQENTASVGIDDDKDRDEIALIRKFFAEGKPVLGICRGHQIINVALGGDMIQHVPFAERHTRTPENKDNIHMVTAQHPFLSSLYGDRFPVNSAHHQAVDRLAPGLLSTCVNDEGITEGFIHENGLVIGVQFHPERIGFANRRPDAVDGAKIFEAFLALF